jgi:hypothetical protein
LPRDERNLEHVPENGVGLEKRMMEKWNLRKE